jgi:hypothetical protein
MFYTFIVLFEKIKYSDRPYGSLQRFYYKRRKVTNLALMGWGCYTLCIRESQTDHILLNTWASHNAFIQNRIKHLKKIAAWWHSILDYAGTCFHK